jgi:mono/diheme cytochrome c family protein
MFFTIAVGSSALVGIYSLVALWYGRLYINGATSSLLVMLAFGASAGGEFVREGVRKPFTVRETLYSNSIHKNEVAALRVSGLSTRPNEYPLRHADRYANDQLKQGALVFREQCSVCHTLGGVNAVDELTHSWSIEQMRLNIAQLQLTKPFMPPFAGTAEEVESLVQFLSWNHQGNPDAWPMTSTQDDFSEIVARIQSYLDEAGTEPADAETRHRALQELANKRWKGR